MKLFIKVEKEGQRPGENRDTKINRTYIESGTYRRKFDSISDNAKINRIIHRLSKRMLKHRSGTLYEDMYWIDGKTGKVIASVTDSNIVEAISYSDSLNKKLKNHCNIITIHSHPNSYPPSINDFNSNCFRGYNLGIVVCHDGKIYTYNSNEYINEKYYDLVVEKYLKLGYNEKVAQEKAIMYLSDRFLITCVEV
ncbi:MAG: hypothetical protein ACI4WM_09270 [Erysipelotrichaceae bacterium]